MATRFVTFEALDGSNFRLVTPSGNRDFQSGVLATDDDDPALPFLEAWAQTQAGIKVTDKGVVVKVAVMTCPVCGQQVGGEAELADHTEAVHVQPESKGQRTTRRRKG